MLQRLFNLIDRWLNPPDTSPSPPVAMCSPYDLPRVDLTTHDIDFLPYRRTVIGVRAVQIHAPFIVRTLEGLMTGQAGDYLCLGIAGERYPCKREVFEKLYEPVRDPAPAP